MYTPLPRIGFGAQCTLSTYILSDLRHACTVGAVLFSEMLVFVFVSAFANLSTPACRLCDVREGLLSDIYSIGFPNGHLASSVTLREIRISQTQMSNSLEDVSCGCPTDTERMSQAQHFFYLETCVSLCVFPFEDGPHYPPSFVNQSQGTFVTLLSSSGPTYHPAELLWFLCYEHLSHLFTIVHSYCATLDPVLGNAF